MSDKFDKFHIEHMKAFRTLLELGYPRALASMFDEVFCKRATLRAAINEPANSAIVSDLGKYQEACEGVLESMWTELWPIATERRESDERYETASSASTDIMGAMGEHCAFNPGEKSFFQRILGPQAPGLDYYIDTANERKANQ